MIQTIKVVIFATLVGLVFNSCFCEDNQELSKEKIFQIFEGKAKELNLPLVNTNKIRYSTFSTQTSVYHKKAWNVGCLHCGITMDITTDSGRIIDLFTNANFRKIDETTYTEEPKPTKSQEDMVKEAERYITIINGSFPKNVCFSEAKFIPDTAGLKSGYYHDGSWTVVWHRVEGEYKYLWDYISLGIHEKYGLDAYHYELFSEYHPPKQINLSKEKAISIAKKNINKIMRSPMVGGWYEGYKAGEIKSAELMIVNPNYVHIPRKDYSPTPQPYARLAWVIHFTSIEKETNKEGMLSTSMIWIDADTGEVLGGG